MTKSPGGGWRGDPESWGEVKRSPSSSSELELLGILCQGQKGGDDLIDDGHAIDMAMIK